MEMKRRFWFFFLLYWGIAGTSWAQEFESSDLPILIIDTGGNEIVDEPKVAARLGIIDSGDGRRNRLGDAFSGYDGWIGIEMRGASSQGFPKKSFAFETREEDGENPVN